MKRSSLRRRIKRTLAVTVAVLIVTVAPLARAADPRVVLVVGTRDEASAQGASSAEARIRAELLADGLDVIILVESDPGDPSTLQSATVRTHSIAAISVSEQGDLTHAQIWLSAGPDREAQLAQVDSVGEADERDRLFALRVADFLYASLIELEPYRRRREQASAAGRQEPSPAAAVTAPKLPESAAARPSPPPPARPPQGSRADTRPRSFPHAVVGLGGTFWAGFGTGGGELAGLGHTAAPTLTGGWWPVRNWRIGALLSGPAINSVRAREGTALVDQEILVAEVQFTAHEGQGWMVHASMAGGVYRMGGNGEANTGYVTSSDAKMRALGMFGVGGRVAMQQNLWLVVRFDSALVTQPIKLDMAKDTKAHTALPLLLGSLGFEVTW